MPSSWQSRRPGKRPARGGDTTLAGVSAVLSFTLDTSSVIAGANSEPSAPYVDQLVEMALAGKIGIFITSGFEVDQRRASVEQRRVNLEYLSRAPVVQVPGPFRFDMSMPNGDVFIDDEMQRLDKLITAIVQPEGRTAERAGKRMNECPPPDRAPNGRARLLRHPG